MGEFMSQISKSPVTIGLIILVLILAGVAGYLASRPAEQVTTTVTAPGLASTVTLTVPGSVSTITVPGTVSTVTVTQTAALTAPTRIEYVIGFAMAVSGPYAVDGPVRRDGGILAIEHINKYLESIGSPIRFRFVHDDTKGAAADALKVVQSMYAAGIKVIVGPFSSGEVRGIMDFANTNKIVVISPSSTSPLLAVPNDYVFRTVPTDLFQAEVVAKVMSDHGIKKVVIMARGDDYGKGLADAFERVFTQKYGGRVSKLIYTVPQPDYASEVARVSSMVAELGADTSTAVFIIAFEDDGLNIIGHARLDPVLSKVRWFGSETLRRPAAYLPEPDGKAPMEVAEFLDKVKLTGVFASPRGSPLATIFEEEYKARFGRSPSPYAYFTYDSVWVAALAILFAGTYDGEAVAKALPIVGEHFIGVTGYKAFDGNGDAAGADYTIWQYRFDGTKYSFQDIGVWKYPAGLTEYYE